MIFRLVGFFFPDFSDKVGFPGLPPGPVFGLRERVGFPGPPAGFDKEGFGISTGATGTGLGVGGSGA